MLIDFHTHIFPDSLAERAISSIKKGVYLKNGVTVESFADGTLAGLYKSMSDAKVDLSVSLPVATTLKQSNSINLFAQTVRNERVISFAGVHPMQENALEVLDDIKQKGFLGIKLHPEFQSCDIDSKQSIALLKKAEELHLYTVIHAGEDYGVQGEVHSAPKKISNALEYVSGKYLIAAHLGGWNLWDDTEKYLVGKSLYFDTAMLSRFIDMEQYRRIIRNHGSENILFGSDSPWESPRDTYECLSSLGLTDEEFSNITYKNAAAILNL